MSFTLSHILFHADAAIREHFTWKKIHRSTVQLTIQWNSIMITEQDIPEFTLQRFRVTFQAGFFWT